MQTQKHTITTPRRPMRTGHKSSIVHIRPEKEKSQRSISNSKFGAGQSGNKKITHFHSTQTSGPQKSLQKGLVEITLSIPVVQVIISRRPRKTLRKLANTTQLQQQRQHQATTYSNQKITSIKTVPPASNYKKEIDSPLRTNTCVYRRIHNTERNRLQHHASTTQNEIISIRGEKRMTLRSTAVVVIVVIK